MDLYDLEDLDDQRKFDKARQEGTILESWIKEFIPYHR